MSRKESSKDARGISDVLVNVDRTEHTIKEDGETTTATGVSPSDAKDKADKAHEDKKSR